MEAVETAKDLMCGADLHGDNVYLVVINGTGETVFQRRVKADLASVNKALNPYGDRIRTVAVESTYNWYWFVDGLREQGRDCRLANPAQMEQYSGLKVTDDRHDARWIAEMLRLNILPECYVYPKEQRAIRDALRRRVLFVRQRTQAMLSLDGLLARQGLAVPSSGALKAETVEHLTTGITDEFLKLQISSLLAALKNSDALALSIERTVLGAIKPTQDFERVQQIPGIGKILAMTILLESGEFTRFPSAGDYASYCRTVKSRRTSNQKQKGTNNTKNGNPYLSWAYAEAALYAVRYYPCITRWYERKKSRRNRPVAMKALSSKLSKAVWHVMQGKEYNEKMLFG